MLTLKKFFLNALVGASAVFTLWLALSILGFFGNLIFRPSGQDPLWLCGLCYVLCVFISSAVLYVLGGVLKPYVRRLIRKAR